MNRLLAYKTILEQLCSEYSVKSLYVFGSILNEKFNDSSDIDFLVAFTDMPIEKYFDNYFALKSSLEVVLNRDVDLLEEQAIKNPFLLNSINNSKQLVYARRN
jgi:predicted nucleotidyltransferase